MIVPYYKSSDSRFTLLQGDCIELLNSFEFKFDMIFADPPYHLSNGGISVQSGRMVSVNKGTWDKSKGFEEDYKFDRTWLEACRNKLKANGTIWISGTYHNIFSIARCLTELGYKILNCITWVKTNPPPNLSCRYFTHSAEYILWARHDHKTPHYFNYELMKEINGGTQMRDVWTLPAIAPWEKSCGKHPTQKPLNVVARAIQAGLHRPRSMDPGPLHRKQHHRHSRQPPQPALPRHRHGREIPADEQSPQRRDRHPRQTPGIRQAP